MGKKKFLKQDIKILIDEVLEDCLTYMLVNDGKADKEVAVLISNMVRLRSNLVYRVNNYKNERKEVPSKQYHNQIIEELISSTNETLKKLSELPR